MPLYNREQPSCFKPSKLFTVYLPRASFVHLLFKILSFLFSFFFVCSIFSIIQYLDKRLNYGSTVGDLFSLISMENRVSLCSDVCSSGSTL